MEAAKQLFYGRGFETTTTYDIAHRARVSKRTLYEHFESKREILSALISETSSRMSEPVEMEQPADRKQFLDALRRFGRSFLEELCDPEKIAMYRLAVMSSGKPGPVAQELLTSGRKRVSEIVGRLFGAAAQLGLVEPKAIPTLVPIYFYVLIGQLQIDLLLGLEKKPSPQMLRGRVDEAVAVIEKFLSAKA
jgi:TetR/AcrR family transcriptional regulator, mexJK operon transcriptional repressor